MPKLLHLRQNAFQGFFVQQTFAHHPVHILLLNGPLGAQGLHIGQEEHGLRVRRPRSFSSAKVLL